MTNETPEVFLDNSNLTTDVIQEILRVKQQYPNMSFYSFIRFAASRIGHCEDDHQLLLGIQMLDKTDIRADVQGASDERSEREMNR